MTASTAQKLQARTGGHAQGLKGEGEMGVGQSYTSFSLLEKQLKTKREGTARRISEFWNVSGTSGW